MDEKKAPLPGGAEKRETDAGHSTTNTRPCHDLLACGIHRATDCPVCFARRAPWHHSSEQRENWSLLIAEFPWLARPEDLYQEGHPAPLLGIDLLRGLLGSLCHPEVAEALVKALGLRKEASRS